MSGRTCLDCGIRIRGRSDKKFCSDQCRNNFNNKLNREANNLVRSVHNILRNNRRIMSDLYDNGRVKVHIDALIVSGYSFTFFTHLVEPEKGPECRYCYEFGYIKLDEDYVRIVKNSSVLEH
ncbi:MAG TPA: hypothetical protein VMW76_08605 [Bacteroidales bacterium]|nr:hypothetical protein [Bacteroidales bacterium]